MQQSLSQKKKTKNSKVEGVAQSAEYLPSMLEVLGLIPSTK